MKDEPEELQLTESQELRKTATDTFDRIWNNLFNPKSKIELTAKEQEVSARWDFAWRALCGYHTQRQVANALMKQFGLSKSVAYDDVAKTMMLYGDPKVSTREAKRALAEEWLVKAIKKTAEKEDWVANSALIKEYIKLNGLEGEAGLDKEELMKKFQAHTIVIVSKMDELNAEAERLRKSITIDVPHEEG